MIKPNPLPSFLFDGVRASSEPWHQYGATSVENHVWVLGDVSMSIRPPCGCASTPCSCKQDGQWTDMYLLNWMREQSQIHGINFLRYTWNSIYGIWYGAYMI